MNISNFMDFIGHFGYFLSALSFLMRDILLLRVLAIFSLGFAILYNLVLALGVTGPKVESLWVVVYWLSVFFLINVIQTIFLLYKNSEILLSEEEKLLLAKSFPSMRTRDFKFLIKHAEIKEISKGVILLDRGGISTSLYLIIEGVFDVVSPNGIIKHIKRGDFIGEAGFALKDQYNGSNYKIISQGGKVYVWNYEKLKKVLLKDDGVLGKAIFDGFLRGLIKKQELLIPKHSLLEEEKESNLSDEERYLHAISLSNLSTNQYFRLMQLGERVTYIKGECILNETYGVGLICKGDVVVKREDNQFFNLSIGNFLGEIRYLAALDFKVKATLESKNTSEVIWFSKEKLDGIKMVDPGLYIEVIKALSKDMANKLTSPLVEINNQKEYNLNYKKS